MAYLPDTEHLVYDCWRRLECCTGWRVGYTDTVVADVGGDASSPRSAVPARRCWPGSPKKTAAPGAIRCAENPFADGFSAF